MVSIITCSINKENLDNFQKSLASTIGVAYELLVWNNEGENRGLCEVYNKMAEKAQYDYLCFCHEDIIFQTQNWGSVVLSIFEKNSDTGLIGVAGGKYKSGFVSGWYSGIDQLDYCNIRHQHEEGFVHLYMPNVWQNSEEKVASIDGVFMACRKQVWEQNRFNEKLLKGFHFYDIDFSLRVAAHHDVLATNRIDLLHFTRGGDYGDKWLEAAFVFHDHCRHLMPVLVGNKIKPDEKKVAAAWFDRLKNEKVSLRNKLKLIRRYKSYTQPFLWYSIAKFLLYRPLRLQTLHMAIKNVRRKQ